MSAINNTTVTGNTNDVKGKGKGAKAPKAPKAPRGGVPPEVQEMRAQDKAVEVEVSFCEVCHNPMFMCGCEEHVQEPQSQSHHETDVGSVAGTREAPADPIDPMIEVCRLNTRAFVLNARGGCNVQLSEGTATHSNLKGLLELVWKGRHPNMRTVHNQLMGDTSGLAWSYKKIQKLSPKLNRDGDVIPFTTNELSGNVEYGIHGDMLQIFGIESFLRSLRDCTHVRVVAQADGLHAVYWRENTTWLYSKIVSMSYKTYQQYLASKKS